MKLLISIFILILSQSAFSSSVTINDTNAVKGRVLNIPVYGNITEILQKNLVFTFEFNSLMLDIKGVVTDETTLLKTEDIIPNIILNTEDFRKSTAVITAERDLPQTSGVLFYLETEVLAGPDSAGNITPVSFSSNGTDIPNTTFSEGVITIPEPVTEIDKSFLSTFYPNPFHRYAKADLTLTKPTRIKVATYNITGANMLSGFCYDECLEKHFRLTDKAGVQYNGDELLMEGDYLLELRNDYSTLSSGAYLIVIQTDYKVLSQRFVVIK